jgi:hypothetical protein
MKSQPKIKRPLKSGLPFSTDPATAIKPPGFDRARRRSIMRSGQNVVAIAAAAPAIGMLGLTLVFPHRSLISGDAFAFYEYAD